VSAEEAVHTRRAEGDRLIVTIRRAQVEEMLAHARTARPEECCGLVGGDAEQVGASVYRLRNVAPDRSVAYDGDPQDLCEAQRLMRARGEQLLGVYHSHPREAAPKPSETDVRLAYHSSAIYFIIGLGADGEDENTAGSLEAFRIFRSEKRWERVEYRIVES
jgi:proteasome lid subunit RPN8/RPN11